MLTTPILDVNRLDDIAFGNLDDLHRWNQSSPGSVAKLVREHRTRGGVWWWVKKLDGVCVELATDQVFEDEDGTITAPIVGIEQGRWTT